MIKDFQTYINEGLFDRNQSEFSIRKTDKGIEQVYIPKTRGELHKYIDNDIENAMKEGTYPNVNLSNIDVSELGDDELKGLFGDSTWLHINPDISNWDIKYIPNKFFNGNKKIKEFAVPNSVTTIGDMSFYNCSGLTSITIPDSVTSIGDYVFCYCSGLTSITIPDSVTSIGSGTFRNCSGLASVVIGDSVTRIGDSVFSGCSNLTSVEIPNSVTSIGDNAFLFCGDLTSVIIPNSVTSIGNGAFGWCKGLTSIIIPNSVTTIGWGVFFDCKNLNTVIISKHCDIADNSFPRNCKIIKK